MFGLCGMKNHRFESVWQLEINTEFGDMTSQILLSYIKLNFVDWANSVCEMYKILLNFDVFK